MMLMLDQPVHAFNTRDEIRARYRGGPESRRCIASAEEGAAALFELVPALLKIEPDVGKRGRE